MKHFSAFLLGCLLLVEVGTSYAQKVEKISFASWNIRWQSESDIENGNAWKKRFEPIANVIRFYDFDIVAMQEGSASKRDDLAPLLNDYVFIEIDSTEHNPILIKKDMFKLLDKGKFYLSETPEKKSKSWDSKHNRFCLWAKLQKDSTQFFVFNTHFDYHGKTARTEGAKVMYQWIPSIAANTPYIAAGDFNSVEGSVPYEILMSIPGIKDAKDVAQFTHIVKKSYNYFDPYRNSKWDLDHVFVDSRIPVYRYGVLNEMYFDGESYRYPSDHSPIMMVFELPAASQP
ncbi:endonuclease/exonuclease/phosphatase family protein [Fibrobacter sp.]|uniref:endonuclease/exonuclease/phosphatase family protein n=1 Tax=Fibrobacter sp. TaxID=35828 RepID=UPI00388FB52A